MEIKNYKFSKQNWQKKKFAWPVNKKKISVSQNGTGNQKLDFKKQKFRKWARKLSSGSD